VEWTNRDSTTPEELLWKSVIVQFFWDIILSRRYYDKATNGGMALERANLESHRSNVDNEWMCEVCFLADIPYDKFRTNAYMIIDGKQKHDPFQLRRYK